MNFALATSEPYKPHWGIMPQLALISSNEMQSAPQINNIPFHNHFVP